MILIEKNLKKMRVPKETSNYLYWKLKKMKGQSDIKNKLLFLLESQYYSPSKIQDLQFDKLSNLLQHCYDTVPYYKKVFDERGILPKDITSQKELTKLPILSRNVLRANEDDLLSSKADFKTLKTNFSSGSTGVRACFKQDASYRGWMRAHQIRTYGWCADWELGDPFLLLWGSEIYWSQKAWLDRLENYISNRREFNTFKLSNSLIKSFLEKIVKFKPHLISTYTNAMYLLAKEAESRNLSFPYIKAIQGTSEPLPPFVQEHLKRVFDCEVYNKYGSRESNVVSHESPNHEEMCIQEENVYVEFLNEKGDHCQNNEKGKVVLTCLNNLSMPLIRYETQDIAAPIEGYCSSGLGLSRMTTVSGRIQDLILTPNEDYVDGYFFTYLIMRFSEIQWFQVIQHEIDYLYIKIFAPKGLNNNLKNRLIDRIHHHTGCEFRIEFELLKEMPDSSTGKFRICISELTDSYRFMSDSENAKKTIFTR